MGASHFILVQPGFLHLGGRIMRASWSVTVFVLFASTTVCLVVASPRHCAAQPKPAKGAAAQPAAKGAAAETFQRGDKVFVLQEVSLKEGSKVLRTFVPGWPLWVEGVEKETLRVTSVPVISDWTFRVEEKDVVAAPAKGVPVNRSRVKGTLEKRQVASASRALESFTAEINRKPKAAAPYAARGIVRAAEG